MTTVGWLALLLACRPPVPYPPATQRWTEVSLTAQGDARIETEVMRETQGGVGVDRFGTRVLRTVGELRVGEAEPLRYDSAAPRPADPWMLRWQHAISAVPATVSLDERGRPAGLVDADAWRRDVDAAVLALPKPPGTSPPIDPEAFVADLARTFPGLPVEGTWRRTERLAGVLAEREETCVAEGRRDGVPLWRCQGSCRAVQEEGPQLHATDCWTEVWFDRSGLVGVESGYAGTRVWLEGGMVADAPIAGQQLVVRREGP